MIKTRWSSCLTNSGEWEWWWNVVLLFSLSLSLSNFNSFSLSLLNFDAHSSLHQKVYIFPLPQTHYGQHAHYESRRLKQAKKWMTISCHLTDHFLSSHSSCFFVFFPFFFHLFSLFLVFHLLLSTSSFLTCFLLLFPFLSNFFLSSISNSRSKWIKCCFIWYNFNSLFGW